jgi:hypothetical protein
LPDDDSRLGYDIYDTKVNIYSSVPSLGEDRTTTLSSILYSDKTPIYSYIPENKFKDNSKGKFLLYLDALEKSVQDIGEEKLRRNATATTQSIGVSGAYNVETNEIAVPDYRVNNEDVVAHELVHAQAIDAIANPAPHQREAVKRLNTLFKHVQDHLANNQKALFPFYVKDEEYGLTSIQEFAAEGISNPAFQFLLSIIPYENTSAWGKFAKTIAELLGIKNTNAFTEFLNLYDQITQPAPVEETPAATETPVVKTKKPTAKERQAQAEQKMFDLLGARVGDTITFSQDIGYITANKPLVISSISNAGEMSVTDPSRGSSTSEKLSQIQAQAGRGLTWEVTPAAPKTPV